MGGLKPLYAEDGVRIHVFADDHPPPHFHILVEGRKISVEIATNRIMRPSHLDQKTRKRIAAALQWAMEHRQDISLRYLELNRKRR